MSLEAEDSRGTLVLVKLGGSLITDKRGSFLPRAGVIARLASEIAAARRQGVRLLIGHGSGSFGHVAAKRHGLGSGLRKADGMGPLVGVSETQDAASRLHRQVMAALLAAGAEPFSLAPSSFVVAASGQPETVSLGPLIRALDLGLLPVVYGDVVMDREWGACICSTETLYGALCERLAGSRHAISKALWMGETGGIYDAEGVTVPRVDEEIYRRLRKLVGGAEGTDVTGGMAHRLETTHALARQGVESFILDGTAEGRLERALVGEPVPGTQVIVDR